jgi:hypothetical protein
MKRHGHLWDELTSFPNWLCAFRPRAAAGQSNEPVLRQRVPYPFDHFVKQTLGARCYIRYADDFVLFGDDKGWLSAARERCRDFLTSLRLR